MLALNYTPVGLVRLWCWRCAELAVLALSLAVYSLSLLTRWKLDALVVLI